MTRVDCDEARDLLQAYEDDELSATERTSVETHLESCSDCARALADLQHLRERIRAAGTYPPPARLEARIRAALGAEHDGASQGGWRRPAALAASHLAMGLLGAAIAAWALMAADTQMTIARDVVAAHVRAMLAQQIVQVASADSHTVRPWFAGRVAFAPPVVDLSAHGFPLAGARVDLVLDRTAAALVYQRRKHQISVFVLPESSAPGAGELLAVRNGYTVMAWRQNGFAHFAVSDLNAAELGELARHLGKLDDK